ncbi:hypothetical protein MC885_001684 [Smutsia gigantea]|nr:hypothetical protein MC885_001684 [Smutsia gigantea]
MQCQGECCPGQRPQSGMFSGLRLAFVGVTQVALIWKSKNGTITCQMLLESIGSCEELTQDLAANISDLQLGIQHNITVYLLESNETHRDPLATENGLDANNTETFTQPPGSPTAPVHPLHHTDPPLDRPLTFHTQVLDFGLTSHAPNKAPVHSRAADGTEGQPQCIDFSTSPAPVSDFRVTCVSIREIGLAWSSNDSVSFKICITSCGETPVNTTTSQSIVINGLQPATSYVFEIVPQGPNGTEGASQTVGGRTGKQCFL